MDSNWLLGSKLSRYILKIYKIVNIAVNSHHNEIFMEFLYRCEYKDRVLCEVTAPLDSQGLERI